MAADPASADDWSLASKPAHVPPSLVFDFDLFRDPALLSDPHARIIELLATAPPMFWTPRNGGHWLVSDYEGNFTISRNTELFSSAVVSKPMMQMIREMMPPGTPRIPTVKPIFLDPPEHSHARVSLASVFSPKSVKAMQDDIRSLTRSLLTDIASTGSCEFMSAIAEPLPVQVFLKMMGLPLERMSEFRKLVKEGFAGAAEAPEKTLQFTWRILDSMRETILQRRESPADDLISLLWRARIDGQPTTLEDVEDFCLLLFFAGLDTVMQAIGFATRHLAADLTLQRRLRAHPELIAEAREEMLRRYSFIIPPRRVSKDTVFRSVDFKEDDRIFLLLPGANLDPRHFPRPEVYDLDRTDKAHLAFNAGPHHCLGSHLARLELQIFYDEVLAVLPDFSLDPIRPAVLHGGHNLGVSKLYIQWVPAG